MRKWKQQLSQAHPVQNSSTKWLNPWLYTKPLGLESKTREESSAAFILFSAEGSAEA